MVLTPEERAEGSTGSPFNSHDTTDGCEVFTVSGSGLQKKSATGRKGGQTRTLTAQEVLKARPGLANREAASPSPDH